MRFLYSFLTDYKSFFFKKISKSVFEHKNFVKKNPLNELVFVDFFSLLFECKNDFGVDFSIIAFLINELKIADCFFVNNYFNVVLNNSSFSIDLKKDFDFKKFDYSFDYYFLKNDDLFLGFPYSINFFKNGFNDYYFNGRMSDLKRIFLIILNALGEYFLE